MGRYDEAIQIYGKTLDAKPGDAYTIFYIGLAQMALAQFNLAEKSLRDAIQAKPDLVQAYGPLAYILSQQQRFAEADKLMRETVKIAPNNAAARISLGSYLSQRGNLAEGETQFKEALRIEPNNPVALNDLGYYNGRAQRKPARGAQADSAGSGRGAQQSIFPGQPRLGSFQIRPH
jgi:Flp pilus assembly protein TadD